MISVAAKGWGLNNQAMTQACMHETLCAALTNNDTTCKCNGWRDAARLVVATLVVLCWLSPIEMLRACMQGQGLLTLR
eukprot:m.248221 g.248221  ORF g.248221 m.248221 type:complete len:78 (+) comp15411_c0_seq1:2758-2991(+)